MKIKKDEPEKTLTVRFPESTLQKLRERAIENHRSLNAEIVFMLQQAMKDKKDKG